MRPDVCVHLLEVLLYFYFAKGRLKKTTHTSHSLDYKMWEDETLDLLDVMQRVNLTSDYLPR